MVSSNYSLKASVKNKMEFCQVISTMPKDNHSLMQLYLDGQRITFLFFDVVEKFIKN